MAVAEGRPSRQNPAYRPADKTLCCGARQARRRCRPLAWMPRWLELPCSRPVVRGQGGPRMVNDLTEKIPQWLKSLHGMENELRNAARSGLVLDRQKASEHLAAARRHLEATLQAAQGGAAADGPQTPLRKEGEF